MPIVDGHSYYATITVFFSDGTSLTAAPSNSAPAHLTPLPPGMPIGQTLGCVCPTSAGRTGALQVMNGDPVNTGTGAFSETATDLRMTGYGVPFSLTRTYTSTDTSDGMMGRGTETRSYDLAGELTSVVRGTDQITYTYDPAGNIASRTWNAVTATAAFDNDDRQTNLTATAGTTTFGYDAAAELTSTKLPTANGYTENRTYDPAGRTTRVATTRAAAPPALTLAQYDLTYDNAGNPTTVIGNRAGTTRTDTYTYDPANRVTALCYATTTCTGATQSIKYAYNLVGDRTSEVRTGVTTPGTITSTYDAADQLTATTGAVAAAYTYDRDGNQLTAGADTFSYDLANRTTPAKVAGVTSTYTYDADGNRRTAVSGAATTSYRWDVAGPLPMLATETTGATVRAYRYDPQSSPLSMTVTGAGTHFLTTDWLGSVSDVTTTAGTAEYAYTYEPFGAGPDPAPLVAGAPANPLRFAGEYRDPKSGVYNLRARQYVTGTGRFTSTDPLAPAVGAPAVAAYAYASDQATRLTDPTGEFPCLLGRNPGAAEAAGVALATQNGRDALSGAGAAGRDFVLSLGAPAPVRGQQIINGAKAAVADCYAGLTSTVDPLAHCIQNISGFPAELVWRVDHARGVGHRY